MGSLSIRKFIGAGLVLLAILALGLLLATQIDPGFLTGGKKPDDAAPQMTTASADATINGFTTAANRDPSPPLPSGQAAAVPNQTTGDAPAAGNLSELEQQLFAEALERESTRALELEERKWAAANSPLGQSIHGSVPASGSVPARSGQNQDLDQTGLAQAYDDQAASLPDLMSGNPLPDFDGRAGLEYIPPAAQTRVTQTRTTLAAGTVIAAALMGDIRSELPGLVRAIVTHDIFDSQTLRFVVIPRGAQLLGSYSNQTEVGQLRLFVYWTRVRFPDGRVFDLNRAATLDARGASGLTGRRQAGFLTAIVQGALLGLAQNAGRGGPATAQGADLAEAARIATGQAVGTVTERYLETRLKRGTRFTIPAGTVLNLILERDFDFPAVARDHGALDKSGQDQPTLARVVSRNSTGAITTAVPDLMQPGRSPKPARRAGNTGRTDTASVGLKRFRLNLGQIELETQGSGSDVTAFHAFLADSKKARNALMLVAGETAQAGLPYDRSDYGNWADLDGDCQNTRHEVLESLSTARVLKSTDGCVVTRGRWLDPYTGTIERNPRALDVDHIVPLAWAHGHGAARWPRARKRAFANDPRNLFATKAAVNRAKGARGPLDWLPPDAGFHCAYVTRFTRIVRIWELTYTRLEAQAMTQLRGRLCA